MRYTIIWIDRLEQAVDEEILNEILVVLDETIYRVS